MDPTTLGAAIALSKNSCGADQETMKKIENALNSIEEFEKLGLSLQDGKICQKVERG